MKKTFIIKPNAGGRDEAQNYIASILSTGNAVTIDVESGERKKRSLPANALQQAWIREISEWQGHTERHVRNYVKAELALPILLESNSDIAKKIRYTLDKINYDLMTPAQRIEVMDMFNVTSILNTKQHNRFREQMQAHYLDAGLALEVR